MLECVRANKSHGKGKYGYAGQSFRLAYLLGKGGRGYSLAIGKSFCGWDCSSVAPSRKADRGGMLGYWLRRAFGYARSPFTYFRGISSTSRLCGVALSRLSRMAVRTL